MKDIFAYKVLVWHNDCINGTHHSIKATGATAEQAIKEFSKYLERPEHCRSFTSKNLVFNIRENTMSNSLAQSVLYWLYALAILVVWLTL